MIVFMKNCFLLIAVASFLLGCSGNKKENTLQDEEGTPVINLSSDNVSKVALLPLSEAAAKVEIVSLEVTDESLIGEITKMKVTDSDIWVKHYKDNHVLRFSRSGKFLNKVGKVGQGPEEYIRMADFFVDENTKEVYIQTTIVGVKVYDYEGNQLLKLGGADISSPDRLGSITGMAETENGFVAADGNMREIQFWAKDGTHIGAISTDDIFGVGYPWLEDMQLLDDGSLLILLTQKRNDESANELMFFRLTGF